MSSLKRWRRVGQGQFHKWEQPEGAQVLIQYTGLQTSKAGRSFKGFEVFVAGDAMWTEGAEHPEPPMTRVLSEEG